MAIEMLQSATPWLVDASHWTDTIQLLHWHLPPDLLVLDKEIPQTDLVGDIQKAFNNFVKTGQAWAFLIGLVFGYLINTFTRFG